ncbi:MAG TPA: hypothetical protein VJ756_13500 [Terriglobales bacterium]|nr:hypothetical protein [Terriglobales bacterium]
MEPSEGGAPLALTAKPAGILRQGVRFVLHLMAVYLIVQFLTMWVAGRVHDFVLPFVLQHQPTVSSFQFAFSHLFAFSFFPAVAVGFMYSEWFRHHVALLIWIVPFVVLAYKFASFPSSLFQNHFAVAFHEYFASGFMIPKFHSYHELFEAVGENPDMARGMQQLHYTAPVYAGLGYSLGAWLPIRFRFHKLDAAVQSMKPGWRPSTSHELP